MFINKVQKEGDNLEIIYAIKLNLRKQSFFAQWPRQYPFFFPSVFLKDTQDMPLYPRFQKTFLAEFAKSSINNIRLMWHGIYLAQRQHFLPHNINNDKHLKDIFVIENLMFADNFQAVPVPFPEGKLIRWSLLWSRWEVKTKPRQHRWEPWPWTHHLITIKAQPFSILCSFKPLLDQLEKPALFFPESLIM